MKYVFLVITGLAAMFMFCGSKEGASIKETGFYRARDIRGSEIFDYYKYGVLRGNHDAEDPYFECKFNDVVSVDLESFLTAFKEED
ncbi:hypothetical protein HX017_01820 [Myroides marinus]|uniref:hypothetical protein n=1 Tax=Myroides marinus TaxID=703342 RepID=UPI0025779AFC|nr:hypothetical protein [Myroides marinus]MDM1345860.1 hypothetical protein [Myroides marinus]MDM1349279.1 hypothetical protein [Myroides marinus]MDM1353043.1 hypothetical protein [Myroides marinus]MDM1356489.1 hypothetical protein [Myroides marinus]MDM1360849.1 hypothetical protein [Myroides marinus]